MTQDFPESRLRKTIIQGRSKRDETGRKYRWKLFQFKVFALRLRRS